MQCIPRPSIAMYSSLMVLSLVGNSLLIAIFYRSKRMRTPVHYFIMNMAASDLLIPTFSLPTLIGAAYHDWQWLDAKVLGTILYKLVMVVIGVSFTVSMFSMVAIAVDRFNAVVLPMKPALFSQKTCHRLIIVIWIVSVAVQGYYVEIHCEKEPKNISYLCLFGIIAFVLTLLYSIITFFLSRQKTDLHLASETVKLRATENRKITSMLVIIVIAFYLVWVPHHYYRFQNMDAIDNCSWVWKWIAESLHLFYTVVNFFVFVIFNETFREGCRELLRRKWLCTRCNACPLVSVTPQEHNINDPNLSQQSHDVENHELHGQDNARGKFTSAFLSPKATIL